MKNESLQIDDDFLLVSTEPQSEASATPKETFSDLLIVDNRLLNPLNEMKKKFGSSIVEQIERENNAGQQGALAGLSGSR